MKLTWRNIVIAAGAVCIAVGTFKGLWFAWEESVVRGWPQVPGRVEAQHIASSAWRSRGQRHVDYWPEITYSFAVAGQTYRSASVYPEGPPTTENESEVGGVISRFQVGEMVGVYYDPADPHHSALIPDISAGGYLALIAGGIFLIVLNLATGGPLQRLRQRPDAAR